MFERQTTEPLYAKVLWNRPISAHSAGRLLVVGGHSQGVASLQATYQIAAASGIGSLTLVVPETLRRLLGTIPAIEFAPATVAGSLAGVATGQLMELASYADAVLIGPDLSNNSETAILVESFITGFHQPLILAGDGLGLISQSPETLRDRPNTLVILSMQQLFGLAGKLGLALAIAAEDQITAKLAIVADFWQTLRVDLALVGPEIIIRAGERVSVTPLTSQPANLQAAAAGVLGVSYTQNPSARYEGLSTGAFLIKEAIMQTPDPTVAGLASSLIKVIGGFD